MKQASDTGGGIVAVLTGDFVGSSRLAAGDLDRGMAVVAEVARDFAGGSDPEAEPFARFRGDGWQILVPAPGLALRAALLITTRLRSAQRSLATRTAIGIGTIETLGRAGLADARGPAFEASGHGLDEIGRGRRLAIGGAGIGAAHRIVVDLLDERAAHWTGPQAEALALYLDPADPTLAEIAEALGVTPQAVGYRIAGAGGPTLRRSLQEWEADWAARAERAP